MASLLGVKIEWSIVISQNVWRNILKDKRLQAIVECSVINFLMEFHKETMGG